MPYLLDGNNLVGLARRTSRPSSEDRAALVTEIAARLRRTRASATIFFDGPAGERPTTLGRLTVLGGSGASADDAIVRAVEGSRTPRESIVVTADRGLARRCREAGAKVCTPSEFFGRFGRSPAGGSADEEPDVDVEEWMRFFGDESNRE
jgi:rRNA-processing protein FCF1